MPGAAGATAIPLGPAPEADGAVIGAAASCRPTPVPLGAAGPVGGTAASAGAADPAAGGVGTVVTPFDPAAPRISSGPSTQVAAASRPRREREFPARRAGARSPTVETAVSDSSVATSAAPGRCAGSVRVIAPMADASTTGNPPGTRGDRLRRATADSTADPGYSRRPVNASINTSPNA
ncbi:hypothetical protein H6H00_17195 [Pseudonocardia petroleophila]|uniref:Uncharacterized protein n=1 Tax=Pseudonocardia petroleophila TaxID=37331 RepID=A0A7G7MT86_9PSEU|nr:hypothetical protein [Pseudonocardia petroleophila]QNG55997.1 hypothetical protein H6H00_17195 [Pseudonocardia petroleophila]